MDSQGLKVRAPHGLRVAHRPYRDQYYHRKAAIRSVTVAWHFEQSRFDAFYSMFSVPF